MNWILDNWYLIVGALAIVSCVVMLVIEFINRPNSEQLTAFTEWLKYGVTIAEKALGSGTGQLKLRMVWDLALTKFPWIERIMEFERFSQYVDEALIWLNKQLESNNNLSSYVEGSDSDDNRTE